MQPIKVVEWSQPQGVASKSKASLGNNDAIPFGEMLAGLMFPLDQTPGGSSEAGRGGYQDGPCLSPKEIGNFIGDPLVPCLHYLAPGTFLSEAGQSGQETMLGIGSIADNILNNTLIAGYDVNFTTVVHFAGVRTQDEIGLQEHYSQSVPGNSDLPGEPPPKMAPDIAIEGRHDRLNFNEFIPGANGLVRKREPGQILPGISEMTTATIDGEQTEVGNAAAEKNNNKLNLTLAGVVSEGSQNLKKSITQENDSFLSDTPNRYDYSSSQGQPRAGSKNEEIIMAGKGQPGHGEPGEVYKGALLKSHFANTDISISGGPPEGTTANAAVLNEAKTGLTAGTGEMAQETRVALENLAQRVLMEVKAAAQTRGRQRTLSLTLEPAHLGRVILKVSLADGEIKAHFFTTSIMARERLEELMPQVKELLAQNHYKLNEAATFFTGDSGGGPGQGWGSEGNFSHERVKFVLESEIPDSGEEAAVENHPSGETSTDYLI